MSIEKLFPNRLAGIPFINKSERITSGSIFWVDSNTGSDDNTGRDPRQPMKTIDAAIGKCTASKGDVIYVMPGHTESIAAAAGINCDVAGVSIIGLGNGTNRPLITTTTAAAADFDFNAANVLISNLQFTTTIDSLENFITIGANNATIEDCYFYTSASAQALCFINLETTYDNMTVRRCRFIQGTDPGGTDAAAGTGVFYFVDSENITIEDCEYYGNFETAIYHNKTTAAKNVWIKRCVGYCALSTSVIGELVEGMTGGDVGSLYINPNATDVTTAQLFGTESTTFFLASYFGNDSGGGQGAVFVTVAT